MDSCPYTGCALSIRRELEPSMLNGDAHYSTTREVELRIWPLPGFQRLERPQHTLQSAKRKAQRAKGKAQRGKQQSANGKGQTAKDKSC